MSDWDAMAAVWLARPTDGLWRRHSDAVNASLVERWLPTGIDRVLKTDLFDEAVGDGLVPSLAARAARVTGVDLNAGIVEAARRRHPATEACVADVRALPFEDAAFDAVVSNSTLDHFDDEAQIAAAIAELGRVMRPGGRLVLTLDNPRNPVLALAKALPRAGLNRAWRTAGRRTARVGLVPYYVGATLAPAAMREQAQAAGLNPVAETTLVHAPRVVAVMLASLLEQRSRQAQERFLRALRACERLGATRAGRFTAHLNALLAVKPEEPETGGRSPGSAA